jgi:3-dehydroquinate synthetase
MTNSKIIEILQKNIQVKIKIVEQDEKETKNIRNILNY